MFKRTETTDTLAIGPLAVSITRREFFQESAAPIAATVEPKTLRYRPLPILTMMGGQDGTTGITRAWIDGDHARCRLCPVCKASEAADGVWVCTVFTNQNVSRSEAPLYSLEASNPI